MPDLKEAQSPAQFYGEMNKTIRAMLSGVLGHWAAMRETPSVDPPSRKCDGDNMDSSNIEKSLPDESGPFLVSSPGIFGFANHQLSKAMRVRVLRYVLRPMMEGAQLEAELEAQLTLNSRPNPAMTKGAQYDGAQLKEEKSFFIARAAIRPDEKKRHVWELLMGQPPKGSE